MANYTGIVNGIDAQATPGLPLRCLAFINGDNNKYIQVTTFHQTLQTALELASFKSVNVEVTFDDSTADNTLIRVRLLDR